MLGLTRFNKTKQLLLAAENKLENSQNEINAAKSYIRQIENGDLDAPYPDLKDGKVKKDTLAESLISMRNQLKSLDEKETQRKWITEGLNKFMVILRQQDEVEDSSQIIISELIKYIGANQGGIYIADHEKEVLELAAFYAYDRQKFINQQFQFGEGIIGQVFLEKETQLIKVVPEEYIRITSGLGDAPPRCIVIVPLKINEEVNGILELATFGTFENYHIEFLEKLGEYIASSLETLKKNSQTKTLLRKSQEQTEQLTAQEEEIKQNMEEMQATQEELARKEAESQSILIALKDSYYVAEIDLKGKIQNVNALLRNLIAKSRHTGNIEGESYANISHIDKAEFEEILKQNMEGNISSRTNSFEWEDTNVWLSETYSPIYDAHKNVSKILMIATDITNEVLQKAELEKKSLEVEEIRNKEKARADHSIKTQSKMMERYMQKAQATESELKAKVKELEAQLNQVNES